MNSDIVKKRLDEVIENDATAESTEDFFATHVSFDQLALLDNFVFEPPTDIKKTTEEDVFEKYVNNPNNIHQFIVVYGEAGTGKSHLIRWFKEKFEKTKSSNEVVLFLNRSDNSLKGTIKQLLGKPEVSNLENKELYDRLTSASASIEPQKLKDMIYYNFIVEVNSDLESANNERSKDLKQTTKMNLPAFLNNDCIRKHMLRESGPVERIFSKVAEQAIVDIDVEAKFYPEDFMISSNILTELQNSGADRRAIKLAKKLVAEDSRVKYSNNLSNYLNEFIDTVIQTCAGIEPADFKMLFKNIREQLYKEGKELTVFIEDITSATGVNKALLDALSTEHKTVQDENICRISSIIGCTSGYIQSDIRSHLSQRVTKYVYIPTGALNDKSCEFVAKYINTLSLENNVLKDWVDNGASQHDYPIHKIKEGLNWEYWEGDNIKLSLYPFTKNAIKNLYKTQLTQQTPRYIIKDIIKPVLSDVLYRKDSFPSEQYKIFNYGNSIAPTIIRSRVVNSSIAERMIRFAYIWGDISEGISDDQLYYFGLKKENYLEFDLPIELLKDSNIEKSDKPKKDNNFAANSTIRSSTGVLTEPQVTISPEDYSKYERARNFLDLWVNGEKIDISVSRQESGIIRGALEDLKEFVIAAIDWQIEGLSLDLRERVRSLQFYTLSNTKTETKGYIKLEATQKNVELLLSFVKYKDYGKGSWNYENSYLDCYTVTNWFITEKENILSAIKKLDLFKYHYCDCAIAVEIYKKILYGQFSKTKEKNLTPADFFKDKQRRYGENGHSNKWEQAITWLNQDNRESLCNDIVQNTYNLRQGISLGKKVVINYPIMCKDIARVLKLLKSNQLVSELPEDITDNRFNKVFKVYQNLNKKIDDIMHEEISSMSSYSDMFCKIFDIDMDDKLEPDTILDLIQDVKDFYEQMDKAGMHVQLPNFSGLESKSKQIADAINRINDIVNNGICFESLVLLSSDPFKNVKDFYDMLSKLSNSMSRVEDKLKNEVKSETQEIITDSYKKEKEIIRNDLSLLKEVRGDVGC